MTTTIPTVFDQKALPTWAQQYGDVVALAQADGDFRASVFTAKTAQVRLRLIEEAERVMNYRLNRRS